MRPSYIDWARKIFACMADGGTWTIPRSGLVFQRRGDGLVLIERSDKHALWVQFAEYDQLAELFGEAGIEVSVGDPYPLH